MDKKNATLLYAEHLHLLISRCGWRVTKVRGHYTFEQSEFKEEFGVMNQISRQNSQDNMEM